MPYGGVADGWETPDRSSVYRVQKLPILLANLLQSSRSTFSWGSFPSFFAFKAGMLNTQISAPGGWPTVSLHFLRVITNAYSIRAEFSGARNFSKSPKKPTEETQNLFGFVLYSLYC